MAAAGNGETQTAAIEGRLAALRREMARARVDAVISVDRSNTFYLTGFTGTSSITVISRHEAVFLTDFRYMEKAERDLAGFDVRKMVQGGTDELSTILKSLGAKQVGFEGTIAYNEYLKLRKAAGRARMVEAGAMVAGLRAVKDATEIATIASNQRLNEKLLAAAANGAAVGTREAEIRAGILNKMTEKNVEEAFPSIIAAAANTSLPHAVPGTQRVRRGEYLLIDMGVRADGYHSDLTRTFVVGKATARHREIYDVVLKAQAAALAALRPGAVCKDVDAAARNLISEAGYGDYFGHGLGHGVGIQIHEAPTLNPRSEQVLEDGMVVTVEPGIYLPGFGGVRIEDLVVITEKGYQNLTTIPKRFKELAAA